MPTYSYRCVLCTHLFEEFRTFKEFVEEPDKKKCPKCGRLMIPSRIIYPPIIVFKGDGFYSNTRKKEDEPS